MAHMDYDLTIIGGGSGGLPAARIATSLGARVLVVDKERLGGDCLYTGCVPSKSLIHAAQVVHQTRSSAHLGLMTQTTELSMALVADYIQGVITQVHDTEKVYTEGATVQFGSVSFQSPTTLLINNERITSRATLIATGSHPASPQIEGLPEAGYLTNADVFQLTALPASLLIVGGGPVGVELAQALARLGVRITLVQRPAHILPREEPEVSDAITRVLQSEGVTLLTNAHVLKAARSENIKQVIIQQDGATMTLEADEILLAAGRQPNVSGLHLEAAGIAYNPTKGIKVDAYLRTSTPNIFAIGDVIGGNLFTHVAAYQASIAVRNALLPFGKRKVDYRALPWCTFTDPEAARVGLTYSEAQQQHRQVRELTFPWSHIDRAQTENAPAGFIKLILAGKKEKIVGAHMVGLRAGELLGEITLAIQHRLTVSDILATIHPYPTLQTGLQQACFAAYLSSKEAMRNKKVVGALLKFRR
ncbi:dihydrolipoyl dehydrogenase family protein [Tengunoibacter tsumagoiensis]|uniref:Mercuric reductase n=1 Tax=Tengunoibacter tsumagoiensis TaxID=2014871 RepID=A0A401ZZV2_9CHLR|nr:NAD(P)/FAD-dependent oxidoreductase [Tengunoibacter tsumagoiensis]GCE12385.1 mercuric reductase [Tengunoibacter tsumagoiensis]